MSLTKIEALVKKNCLDNIFEILLEGREHIFLDHVENIYTARERRVSEEIERVITETAENTRENKLPPHIFLRKICDNVEIRQLYESGTPYMKSLSLRHPHKKLKKDEMCFIDMCDATERFREDEKIKQLWEKRWDENIKYGKGK